jgi:hypothetical protein
MRRTRALTRSRGGRRIVNGASGEQVHHDRPLGDARMEIIMTTAQGSLDLLNDPVAQQLLVSTAPARFAYVWSDGTPRVVPIGFHWNGRELVLGTPTDSPKAAVLHDGAAVALTIDSEMPPWKVLLVRGAVALDVVDGIAPEYEAMSRRVMGDEGADAWLSQLGAIAPQMLRIRITPTWVGILDFESRFPSAVERGMERFARAHAG